MVSLFAFFTSLSDKNWLFPTQKLAQLILDQPATAI
jgi:hypothetical protein